MIKYILVWLENGLVLIIIKIGCSIEYLKNLNYLYFFVVVLRIVIFNGKHVWVLSTTKEFIL